MGNEAVEAVSEVMCELCFPESHGQHFANGLTKAHLGCRAIQICIVKFEVNAGFDLRRKFVMRDVAGLAAD